MSIGPWIKSAFRSAKQFGIKNASHILMAAGTGCSISALISAIRATPEMRSVLFCKQVEKTAKRLGKRVADIYDSCREGSIQPDELTKLEIVKAYIDCYGLAALQELIAIICFWGAHGIDIRRQAVLAGICTTLEESLREYQSKVKEMIGKDAEKEIQNAVAQDIIDKTPAINTVILPGDAETEWIIGNPGQRFRSTYFRIKDVQNEANWEMIEHMYLTETDLFWMLDPEKKYLKPQHDSGQIGWNIDNLLVLDIGWGTNPDHTPVGVITYKDKDGNRYDPMPGYWKSL